MKIYINPLKVGVFKFVLIKIINNMDTNTTIKNKLIIAINSLDNT